MWCQSCMVDICSTHRSPVVWRVTSSWSIDWCGLIYQHLSIIILNCGYLASLVPTVPLICHLRVNRATSTIILVQILHFSLRREQGWLLTSILVGRTCGIDCGLDTLSSTSNLYLLPWVCLLLRISHVWLLVLTWRSRLLCLTIRSNSVLIL